MTERPPESPQWDAEDPEADRLLEALRQEIRAAKEKSRRYRAGLKALGRLDEPS
ncbi:MAG: hypothetical protein JWP49_1004 [Phenylobacterium sp.]|nr:hypothetical protein [Phenylobacterium sp.]